MRCVLSLVMRVMLNQTIAVRLSCISVDHEAADLRDPPVPARHLTGYAARRNDPQ